MVKVYDPDKNLRLLQNIIILSILYSFAILFILYIGFVLTIGFVEGPIKLFRYFTAYPITHPDKHFVLIFKTSFYYIKLLYSNRLALSFTAYQFFFPKVILGTFISPIVIFLFLGWKFRVQIMEFVPIKKEDSLHGDAHWASNREIKKAGLRAKKGLLMGKTKSGFLITTDYQHTLLFAPTGSGKGVGFCIPNMVFWEESLIVHDIKLENFEKGSGWRKNKLKQQVYLWCPADAGGKTHCYNPLDWISDQLGKQVDDVQKIMNLLLPKQEFWTNEARTLGVGMILLLIADPKLDQTFGELVRQVRSDDFAYTVATALDTLGDIIHPVGYMNLAAAMQKADKERSGVISNLNSGLELWGNPLLDAATAKSDFNFTKMKTEPTTVFVGLTPDSIKQLQPLMTVFYQQATAFMSVHMPTPEEKYGVLFLMDEFPTVGKLEQFLSGIAYFRGYHVRLFLVVQDTQQLKGTYEDTGMNSFLSNSTYRITFAANNFETAKLISDLIGTFTAVQTSGSKSKFLDLNANTGSISIAQSQRALLMPQEVINLDRNQQIILIEANPPVKTEKIFYFKEKLFMKRIEPRGIDVPIQQPIIKRSARKGESSQQSSGGGLPSG